MKRLGFIVNPLAGIGGKVGLKGSDGSEIVEKALSLGAELESGKKALVTMKVLKNFENEFEIYTYPAEMGADICQAAGLNCHIMGEINTGNTTATDTIKAAQLFKEKELDLILFAGGDGTARNILDAVGLTIPVLGIPTGCKIHSGVYAINPKTAGQLMGEFAQGKVTETKDAEVMDIDEELFRQGVVQARLYGYLQVPNENRMVQNLKSGRGISERVSTELMSNYMVETWRDDTLYIVGTGSTLAEIMKKLKLKNTLLGVDLVYRRKIIANDCTEKEILDVIKKYKDKDIKILVTVIGGQGYIFGRGNQQISANVIKAVGKENIIVVASQAKMIALFGKPLYVDTGDEAINEYLKGYIRVIVGYERTVMAKVSN